jgi:hypothetical protein
MNAEIVRPYVLNYIDGEYAEKTLTLAGVEARNATGRL